ncbi:MAG: hypothetical protein VX335_01855 [Pseudomonadota bacterium]|nr:hypothetical protein [Pseudomonadota bacterium]
MSRNALIKDSVWTIVRTSLYFLVSSYLLRYNINPDFAIALIGGSIAAGVNLYFQYYSNYQIISQQPKNLFGYIREAIFNGNLGLIVYKNINLNPHEMLDIYAHACIGATIVGVFCESSNAALKYENDSLWDERTISSITHTGFIC